MKKNSTALSESDFSNICFLTLSSWLMALLENSRKMFSRYYIRNQISSHPNILTIAKGLINKLCISFFFQIWLFVSTIDICALYYWIGSISTARSTTPDSFRLALLSESMLSKNHISIMISNIPIINLSKTQIEWLWLTVYGRLNIVPNLQQT